MMRQLAALLVDAGLFVVPFIFVSGSSAFSPFIQRQIILPGFRFSVNKKALREKPALGYG